MSKSDIAATAVVESMVRLQAKVDAFLKIHPDKLVAPDIGDLELLQRYSIESDSKSHSTLAVVLIRHFGEGENNCCTFAEFTLCPNPPAIILN